MAKALRDVLGKFADDTVAPNAKKWANAHGPVVVHDTPGNKSATTPASTTEVMGKIKAETPETTDDKRKFYAPVRVTEGKSGLDRYKKKNRDGRSDKRDWQKKGTSPKVTNEDVEEIDETIMDVIENQLETVGYSQLDELSKKTLGSYVKSAAQSMANHSRHAKHAEPEKVVSNKRRDHALKAYNRHVGIRRAVDKLTKEEYDELNELSKKTLASYIDKSSKDANTKFHSGKIEAGMKRDRGLVKALKKVDEETIEEGLRKIGSYKSSDGKREAHVYRDSEWEEHRVKFHKDGKHLTKADYHTDDKEDAHDTAKHYVKEDLDAPPKAEKGSYHIKVRGGNGGMFAPFKIWQNGKVEKCGNWYKDKADAQMAAGLKEEKMKSFTDFVKKTHLDESKPVTAIGVDAEGNEFRKIYESYAKFEKWHEANFETHEVKSIVNEDVEFEVVPDELTEEQLNEEAGAAYAAHHAAALTHVHEIAKALNHHKRALDKREKIHSWHADDMKHIARQFEDLKDNLSQRAEQMHLVSKAVHAEY